MDYYAPLFFSEIAPIKPDEVCEKFNLCESAKISSQVHRNNSCGLCKDTIAALLVELNDPDTKVGDLTDFFRDGKNWLTSLRGCLDELI